MDLKQRRYHSANKSILFVGCSFSWLLTLWPGGVIWEGNSDISVGWAVALLLEQQEVLGFLLVPAGHYSAAKGQ